MKIKPDDLIIADRSWWKYDDLDGKLNASQGHALVNAAKAWLKAHEERKIMELEQRVRYLEAEKDLETAKAKKGGK